MDSTKKNSLDLPMRIFCFLGMIVLITASVMSFNYKPTKISIFSKPEYTVFAINSISAFLAFLLVLFPDNYKAQVFILAIQSVSTTCTGFDTLGIFLYSAAIIILFVNGFFKVHLKEKISVVIFLWMLILTGYSFFVLKNYNFSKRSLCRIALEFSVSFFFFGFYFYIYKKLESLLTTLVPVKTVSNSKLTFPKIGSTLHLSDYGLTDRQIKLVLTYLTTQKNYEALSEQFFISKSTVKKDMSNVFYKFDVSNLKELHILLLQYIVKA